MRPLRFCMPTTFFPPQNFGGDGIFIHRLVNELGARGHRVDVVHDADAYRVLGGRNETPVDLHENVRAHPIEGRFRFLSSLLTQQFGAPVLKRGRIAEVLDRDYDVVHFHNVSLLGGPRLFKMGRGVKLLTTHEHWLVCPTHVLFKYGREACFTKDCLKCVLLHKRPPQYWRYTGLIPRMLKHVDGFISPSAFTARKHEELGLDMKVIPYFLPALPKAPEAATARARAILADHPGPFFFFVGRLEKIKGLQTILPVFRRSPNLKLLVAGEGAYGEELRALAADLRNVVFLGALTRHELTPLYERATAVVVPSICHEVLGQIIIEGFSVGTPSVVCDLGAPPDIVGESGGGFVYRSEDELVDALTRLSASPELRRRKGENGRAYYERTFTADAHLAAYFALIEEILDRKKKALR
jgi:glycosyltransferase involved in cell wall biosynthesis